MNKNIFWWILGLLCPPIGIILYFVWKKTDKAKSSNLIKGSIVGICIIGVILLFFVTNSKDYLKRDVNEWYEDVKSNNTVITVIGASYCGHCQEYKPYITTLADKHKLNLYFYEIDTLSEEDNNKLTTSFDLIDYQGSVPFTIIFKNGQAVATHEGYESSIMLYDFFKENGIV